MLVARNEEVWSWAWARKRFEIEPVDAEGELFLFAYEYPGNTTPLEVHVGDAHVKIPPDPETQGHYTWRTVAVPADELDNLEVAVTISCAAPAMSAWILALDVTGPRGGSLKSVDQGRTWRPDGMGYDCVLSGEYLVRLRTPGDDPVHPDLPFVHEDTEHPRLKELGGFLEGRMGSLPEGDDFERARAVNDWLAGQWPHMDGKISGAYSAWDARTILDWTSNKRGHANEAGVTAFCVHFTVAFVQMATALGLEARMLFSEVTAPKVGDGHCVPEVYCRDLGKWVVFDPDVNAILADKDEPVGGLEVHNLVMSDRYGDLALIPGEHYESRPEWLRDFWKENVPRSMFRRWGFLPRNDFFSHPEAFPCEHGLLNYHNVDMLWYDDPRVPAYPWHPYRSSNDEDFLYHRGG